MGISAGPERQGGGGGGLVTDHVVDEYAVTRRAFLIGLSAAGLGLVTYSGTIGRHELEMSQKRFAIRDLPDAFVGFRMVQLSDIHLEEYTEPSFLEDAVRRINALEPDMVVLTGDYISRGPRKKAFALRTAGLCAEILTGLKAPQRYGILGNHDAAVGPEEITALLKAKGTPILSDEFVAIERGGERIWLSGARDPGVLGCDLFKAVPEKPKAPVVFLCHEPDFADNVMRHPRAGAVNLMLAGHTHGGQIRLPLGGPLVLPPMGKKYVEGAFRLGAMQLYVNRGLGTVGLPLRLNCPAEITQITLERA
ncbi:MAG: metallophosphoesterase [Bryocella sp.]